MIQFTIQSSSTLFYSEFHVLWNNIISDRKKNSGFFVCDNLSEVTQQLQKIIREQTVASLLSIAKERRWAYSFWKTTTTRQENLKYEYSKLIEKVELFCYNIYKPSFEDLMLQLLELSNTTLLTLTPGKNSRGHEAMKNKVDKIRKFSGAITNYLKNPKVIEMPVF